MKELSFTGKVGGDGECFCWNGVPKEDKIQIEGEPAYEADRLLEEEFRQEEAEMRGVPFDPQSVETAMQILYPGEIMIALGIDPEKRYRFTVSAEEIEK